MDRDGHVAKIVNKVVEDRASKFHERLDSAKEKLELDIGEVRKDLGSVRSDLDELKQSVRKHGSQVLDKALGHICKSSPDYWSVMVGPTVVSFRGFNDVSKEAAKELIQDIKHGQWPEAIRSFVKKTAPTSIEIELEGSLYGSVARAGIAWGYDNPAERIDEIVAVIKNIS